jgi:hypothetical protein
MRRISYERPRVGNFNPVRRKGWWGLADGDRLEPHSGLRGEKLKFARSGS